MRNVEYDEAILQKSANHLYERADSLVSMATLLGLLLGGIGGFVLSTTTRLEPGPCVIVGLMLGGAIGYASAQSRAFELRFKAQTLLVQMQIERNTRPRPAAVAAAPAVD